MPFGLLGGGRRDDDKGGGLLFNPAQMMLSSGLQSLGQQLQYLGARRRGVPVEPPQPQGVDPARMMQMQALSQKLGMEREAMERAAARDERFRGLLGGGSPGAGAEGPAGAPASPAGSLGGTGPGSAPSPGGTAPGAAPSPFGPKVGAEEMATARRLMAISGPDAAREYLAGAMTEKPATWRSMGGGVMYHPERGFAKIPGWSRGRGTSVSVDLSGLKALAMKERTKDAVSAYEKVANEHVVPAVTLVDAINRVKKQIAAGDGATIGAVGALARVGESLSSQVQSAAKAAGIDMSVENYDFGELGAIAELGARTRSNLLSLAYTNARSEEPGGRLNEQDVQRALTRIGGRTGSPRQAIAMLEETAHRAVRSADIATESTRSLYGDVPDISQWTATELLREAGITVPTGEYDVPNLGGAAGPAGGAPAAESGPAGRGEWPAVGTVEDGFEYRGGDPSSPDSWRRVD